MSPRHAARFAQGKAAADAGDLAAAERAFLSVVEEDGAAHEAWMALAVIALRRAAPQLAVERASRAVELDRKNAVYLNNLGIAYAESGQGAPAEQALRRALKLKPDYAGAHFNLAKALHKRGKLAEARKEYERAHALEPGALPMQLGLARIYLTQGEPRRALPVLRAAAPRAELAPLIAQGVAETEGVDAALGFLAQHPDNPFARHARAELLLACGRWREGWREYQARPHAAAERPRRLAAGRLLLRAEQGLGDVLFFLRFEPALRARGIECALECPPKLAPLLAGRIALHDGAPAAHQVRLGDLPALLDAEATPPAFPLQPENGRAELAAYGPGPYLGLTWRAGVDRTRTSEYAAEFGLLSKEIAPALLGEAVRGWRGTLVSLQRSPAPEELQALRAAAGAPVHDLAAVNDDLRDALAVLARLDEYVAVSNTNIHLLAGLGRRARVLVPYPPEWRWMREGESPWFPGFPVYRQSARRDWREALQRLRADLFTIEAESPPPAPA
jgi:Flp pilus assembly protein TadD